ncbi:MAG: YkgJ family cysteine cluster protein [Candidatus Methanofastidiosa archaeon]|nr:YkgJ family cysteine cluster protein [Candidatus Methanofastidiosa archaeon]
MKENLIPYRGQRYTCRMCGECCHCRTVPLSRDDMQRIGRLQEDADFTEYNLVLRTPVISRREWDLGCIFLDDRRCRIHQYKPLICRLFPYAMLFKPLDDEDEVAKHTLPDGTGIYLYIDSSCPGVDHEQIEDMPGWLLPLAQRIRIELALTRFYYDDTGK